MGGQLCAARDDIDESSLDEEAQATSDENSTAGKPKKKVADALRREIKISHVGNHHYEEFKLPPSLKNKMMRQLFEACDVSNTGFLDVTECKALAKAFQPDDYTQHLSKKDKKRGKEQPQLKVTLSQLSELIESMDRNSDGKVDYDEFSDFFTCILEMKFNDFDVDESRTIDQQESDAFIDTLLGVDAAKKNGTAGVVKTLEGQTHRKDHNWLEQKRQQYLDRINMDKDKRITLDEFQGFLLAVVSDVMSSKGGSHKMPDGLRLLLDLNMKHIGEDLAAHRAEAAK